MMVLVRVPQEKTVVTVVPAAMQALMAMADQAAMEGMAQREQIQLSPLALPTAPPAMVSAQIMFGAFTPTAAPSMPPLSLGA